MPMIYADSTQTRFFLVPKGTALPPGTFTLQSLTGQALQVDEQAVAGFAVPEAVAQAHVQEKILLVQALTGELVALTKGLDSAQAALGAQARLDKLLQLIGTSAEQLRGDRSRVAEAIGQKLMGLDLDDLKEFQKG